MRHLATLLLLLTLIAAALPSGAHAQAVTAEAAGVTLTVPDDWLVAPGPLTALQSPDGLVEVYLFAPTAADSASALGQGQAYYTSLGVTGWGTQDAGDFHGLSHLLLAQATTDGYGVLLVTWETPAGTVGALEARVRPAAFDTGSRDLAALLGSMQAVD